MGERWPTSRRVRDGLASAVLISMSSGFEHLMVRQRSRAFCGAVLPVVRAARAAHDFELSRQLNAAAISIMSNIAEGHLRRHRRQFAHCLTISAGSLGEPRSCLYLALDRGYTTPATFKATCDESNEIGRMLETLRAAVLEQARRKRDPPASDL
jgi:four helix bundle protein